MAGAKVESKDNGALPPGSPGGNAPSVATAWHTRAKDLMLWVMNGQVNRDDVWGGYWNLDKREEMGQTTTRPAVKDRGKKSLTGGTLVKHFRATCPENIVGLHTTSLENTSKWGAVDVDYHGEGNDPPESNLAAALSWYNSLSTLGYRPLLTDSNGKGGYHLRILFREPAPTPVVFGFLRWLTRDHAGLGIATQPETYPRQPALRPGRYGNWLRLPGRHHTREHWSRVWDGNRWLEGAEAIDFILPLTGDSPDLIPAEARAWKPPRPQTSNKVNPPRTYTRGRLSPVERARRYLRKVPPAVSGQRGHDQAYHVACILVQGFALSEDEALEAIQGWNAECDPPWTEAELRHKLADAEDAPCERPRGYLLEQDRPGFQPKRPKKAGQPSANGYHTKEPSPSPTGGGNGDGPNSPPPGSNTPPGQPGQNPLPSVIESRTNSHRLARFYLACRATHRDHGDRLVYYRESFWLWNRRCWETVPDHETRALATRFIKAFLDEEQREIQRTWNHQEGPPPPVPVVSGGLISDVLLALQGEVMRPGSIPQPSWLGDNPGPRNWLALENGLLDIDAFLAGQAEVIQPHDPRWFSPTCLPYKFDLAADCPKWRGFLARNLRDDPGKGRMLQQWAGLLLLPDVTQQKFLMMVGEGSNGKSVACSVLTALLGEENVSNVPLELFGDKFRLAGTLGKLANIVTEVGELDKIAEGQIKAFVVGDLMEFERKFRQPISAKPTARLVLATNNAPRFSDRSQGMRRRLMLMPFNEVIGDDEKVRGMDGLAFWRESGELPGILNWALAGLADLRQTKHLFETFACRNAADDLFTESNPAKRFLQDHYQTGDGHTFKPEIYQKYSQWCKDNGYRALAENTFGKEVKRTFKGVGDSKDWSQIPGEGKRMATYTRLVQKVTDETDL